MKSKIVLPLLMIAFIVLIIVFCLDVFKGGLFYRGEKQKLYETPHSVETTESAETVESVLEDVLSEPATLN